MALRSLHILYMFALRAEIVTIFEPKMVTISVRNANIYKICKLCQAIFSKLYNISQPNCAILLISLCSFQLCCLIPFSLLRLQFSLTCKLSISFARMRGTVVQINTARWLAVMPCGAISRRPHQYFACSENGEWPAVILNFEHGL